jgi:hypothetical protein
MKTYCVDGAAYWQALDGLSGGQRKCVAGTYNYYDARERCRRTMDELIEACDLRGKSVLSIAPAFGHEEYHFWRNGCPLTMVDLDMNHNIEPLLAALPSLDSHGTGLTYVVGDAVAFAGSCMETYQCVYTSSFSPDERRQRQVKQEANGFFKRAINFVPKRMFGWSPLPEWPGAELPVLPELCSLAAKMCSEDGFFIRQSHAWGVNVLANRYYSDLLRAQVQTVGLRLLRLYCYRSHPTITLAICGKGSIRESAELTAFHGRMYDGKGIIRIA